MCRRPGGSSRRRTPRSAVLRPWASACDACPGSRPGCRKRCVVERAAIAFDDAHDEVDGMLACGGCDPVDVRTGHDDRAIEVAPELIATLRRALPDDRSEVDASRVARNERFREDGELRPALCRFRDQPLELVYRLLAVEPDRSGLDDGSPHPHRANRTSTRP